MGQWAEVGPDGKVKNVIEATEDFIKSGNLDRNSSWVETSMDGKIRGNKYAGIGDTYHKDEERFISQYEIDKNTIKIG